MTAVQTKKSHAKSTQSTTTAHATKKNEKEETMTKTTKKARTLEAAEELAKASETTSKAASEVTSFTLSQATAEETAKLLTELRTMQTSLHLRPRLTKEERKAMVADAKTTPVALINAVASASAVNGGVVAGVAFNGSTARAAIARSPETAAIAQWALEFAQLISDDDVRDRAAVGASTRRIYGMLGDYVRTDEGQPFLGAYETMRDIMRTSLKVVEARATRAEDTAKKAPPAGTAAPKGGPSTT